MLGIAMLTVAGIAGATASEPELLSRRAENSKRGEQTAGTFSIVAADPATGEVGVAVQSKYFCVGAVVTFARVGVGAVATQASVVSTYGPRILDLMASGLAPEKAMTKALADDKDKDSRQLGIVDAAGHVASWTGPKCNPWAGEKSGKFYSAQGNILAGEAVVREMGRAYEETPGTMAERLLAALEAGQAAGGDKRGQQSAALIVERTGYGKTTREGLDRIVDLRVDDNPEPIKELHRLVEIRMRWIAMSEAGGFYREKNYAKAADRLKEALRKYGDDPLLFYDLACYESMGGRKDDALAHLARCLELDPSNRKMADGDSDFDPIRNDENFQKLLSMPSGIPADR